MDLQTWTHKLDSLSYDERTDYQRLDGNPNNQDTQHFREELGPSNIPNPLPLGRESNQGPQSIDRD
jgi:hypothetical protein